MKIGFSSKFPDREKLEWIKAAGFDYVEIALKVLAESDAAVTEQFCKDLKEVGIPCESVNQLFPNGLALCGDECDPQAIAEYLEIAFSRAKAAGVKVAVFGSGGARKAPEGCDNAEQQLAALCRNVVEPAAAKYDILVVMEPLNVNDTNTLNTVAQMAEFVRALGCPHIKGLADTYHMAVNGENYADIAQFGTDAQHMHIANPEGRKWPQKTDAHDYSGFFAALREIGYTGRLTIEANALKTADQRELLAASAAYLREVTA